MFLPAFRITTVAANFAGPLDFAQVAYLFCRFGLEFSGQPLAGMRAEDALGLRPH